MLVITYILSAFWNTIFLSCLGLLPFIGFAFLMLKFSNALRLRLASYMGVEKYVYLTAPGVMVHELSHAFFCLLFRHKIVEVKLFSPGAIGWRAGPIPCKNGFILASSTRMHRNCYWAGAAPSPRRSLSPCCRPRGSATAGARSSMPGASACFAKGRSCSRP